MSVQLPLELGMEPAVMVDFPRDDRVRTVRRERRTDDQVIRRIRASQVHDIGKHVKDLAVLSV